jgi:hypothetical protein
VRATALISIARRRSCSINLAVDLSDDLKPYHVIHGVIFERAVAQYFISIRLLIAENGPLGFILLRHDPGRFLLMEERTQPPGARLHQLVLFPYCLRVFGGGDTTV